MDVNKLLFSFIKVAFSIMVMLLVIYGAVKLCALGYDYGYRLYTEPAMEEAPGKDVLVQVKEDTSSREISELMEEKGLVRDSKLFYVQLMLSGYREAIQPGVYTLNTSMEPKDLIVAMSPEPETGTESAEEATETEDGLALPTEDGETGGEET
ncbi:MAG: endolytic transglycosylase MltG [Blautia sp.]|nr:endolytic transglycosylase MltG [Blautia sp.]